ncbi:hypothetical protein SEA_HUWBERT_76 [Microbacterium phage Huwbert]|nr:hypothetical protein SEA_HUWBERT_76 [Microbacterium phage Huwbert]
MGKHSLRDWNQRQLDKRAKKLEKYLDIQERDALKYATAEIVTRKIYRRDLDKYLERGWSLVQIFSNGVSGSVTAIVMTTKTELAGRVKS